MDRRRIFHREVVSPVVVFLLSDTTVCKFIFHDTPVIKHILELSARLTDVLIKMQTDCVVNLVYRKTIHILQSLFVFDEVFYYQRSWQKTNSK